MKEIKLTNSNLLCLIDDEDLDRVNKFSWNLQTSSNGGIRIRQAFGSGISIGKFLLDLDALEPDHKDRNPLNNQKSNLRPATRSQNCANQNKKKNNTSGYIGVFYIPSTGKWTARIHRNKKSIQIGTFFLKEEAARAYDKVCKKYSGEFAVLNFPAEV